MPNRLLKKSKKTGTAKRYKVRVERKAQKKLAGIPKPYYSKIKAVILTHLVDNSEEIPS